tara:strand:- start:25 stop:519 length:495 start_codon:yes stop_codon:yes gene_type:complete
MYPIKNYETYSINENGIITDLRTGKILKHRENGNGYKVVTLKNPNGISTCLVHRLLAINFIENPNNFPEIDHIDRDKTNNSLKNLRWADDFIQSQNRGVTNQLGLRFICYEKNTKYQCSRYRIKISRNKKVLLNKSFGTGNNTLEDVIKYRNNFCKENNIDILD